MSPRSWFKIAVHPAAALRVSCAPAGAALHARSVAALRIGLVVEVMLGTAWVDDTSLTAPSAK